MANLGETTKVSRMVLVFGNKEYELDGGGGGQPGPDSVNSDTIVDGSIQEQDLNDSVKDRMTITHDSTTGGLRIGGYAKPGNVPGDTTQEDVGQGGGEDTDDDAGFDTGVEDGSDDI